MWQTERKRFQKQTEQHAQGYKLKINNEKEKYLTLVHITWALIMIWPRCKISNHTEHSSWVDFFMSCRKSISSPTISTIRTSYFHKNLKWDNKMNQLFIHGAYLLWKSSADDPNPNSSKNFEGRKCIWKSCIDLLKWPNKFNILTFLRRNWNISNWPNKSGRRCEQVQTRVCST